MVAHRLGDKAKPLFVATEIALRQREARSDSTDSTGAFRLLTATTPAARVGSESMGLL
jgi:hypothetical protein